MRLKSIARFVARENYVLDCQMLLASPRDIQRTAIVRRRPKSTGSAPHREPHHQPRRARKSAVTGSLPHHSDSPWRSFVKGSFFAGLPAPALFAGISLAAAAQTAYKKLFRRRRTPRRKAYSSMTAEGAARFTIATHNIRGIMDRYVERFPVLKRCLKEMDADVVCFQECLTGAPSGGSVCVPHCVFPAEEL